MALGGALGLAWSPVTPGTPRHFAWQAWHKLTSTVVLRGRRGTTSHPPSFCVAGVALMALGGALGLAWSRVTPGTPRHFAWQAWHKLTSTVVLRGRRGTTSHPLSFCVAGVALMALGGALGLAWSPVTPGTPRHFAWQAWHSHPPSFCVAGVALMALGGALGLAWSPGTPGTPRHFAWQAWHKLTSTVVLRGTNSHPPSFCVAGVALMALGGALGLAWSPGTPGTPRHFAWQAWHKLTSTVVLRGRRGTTSHLPSFCVAGVALTHTHTFAWQAWHNQTSTFVLRGRRGTTSHPPSFCVAGVALMALGGALGLAWLPVTPGTPRHFAWQAWHKLTSTVVLRGRRGTTSHPPSFCVAGVALMALGGALGLAWSPVTPGTPRHFAWQAWHKLTSTVVLRGRRGTHGTGWRAWTGLVARDARDAAALCVAGVAQTHIHRRGRRGTHGTGWRAWTGLVARDARDAAALCVAGVAQTHIHRRFAWQAWHNLTSTVVLRGRRGTHGAGWRAWTGLVARDARDAAALCVAGVAQTHIHRRFAWQAWHSWHWVARLDWLGRP